jgi:CHAT domain-containing protein
MWRSLIRMLSCPHGVWCALVFVSSHSAIAEDPAALLDRAERLSAVGNWRAARPLYAETEAAFRARGDRRDELAAKFGRLHSDVESGSYAEVREEVERDLLDPVVHTDPILKIRGLALKGIIDLNLDTNAAESDWMQIQEIADQIHDAKWQNRARGELGILAGVNGDYGKAVVMLNQAIRTAQELNDIGAAITFLTWLGNGAAVNNMTEFALNLFDRALGLARQHPEMGIPIQTVIGKVRALRLAGQPTKAEPLVEQTLPYCQKEKIFGCQAELLNQAGMIALAAADRQRAEQAFLEAAAASRSASLPRMIAESLSNLSNLYLTEQRMPAAEAAIDEALDAIRRVQETYDLPNYLARKAEIEARLGRVGAARSLYQEATDIIEGMMIEAPSPRVKSSLIATMSSVYLGYFQLELNQYQNLAGAFHVLETARGRVLADSMRYQRLHASGSGPSAAEIKIAAIQRELRQVRSPAEAKSLLTQLEDAEAAFAPVEYRRDREQLMMRTQPVALNRVQRVLRPGEVLLEYVLADGQSYCLEIRPERVRAHRLPARREIERVARGFLQDTMARKDNPAAARQLFAWLIAPAMTPDVTAILIVPDGILHVLPFSALVDSGGGRPLIERISVSKAPSGTAVELLRRMPPHIAATAPYLGIAYAPNDAVKPTVASNTRSWLEGGDKELTPLPNASVEVLLASRVFGSRSVTLIGTDASEAALKAEPLRSYRVIHIAAHAVGSDEEPDRAGFVLAPGSKSEDGLWQAREIRREQLNADLVTLSSCETGTGKLQGEEGIMNLARAFLMAGARSVVASLWDVEDRSSAALMTRFYAHIAKGETVADSLRGAQADFLKDFGNDVPAYFWAGWTVIGDGTRRISVQAENIDIRATPTGIRANSR